MGRQWWDRTKNVELVLPQALVPCYSLCLLFLCLEGHWTGNQWSSGQQRHRGGLYHLQQLDHMCIRPFQKVHLQNHLHLPEWFGSIWSVFTHTCMLNTFIEWSCFLTPPCLCVNPGLSSNAKATGLCLLIWVGDTSGLPWQHQQQRLPTHRLSAPIHLWPVRSLRWGPGKCYSWQPVIFFGSM